MMLMQNILPVGQILICADRKGWYQEEGEDAILLTFGIVIEISSNVKHLHGATKDS